jgi:hypothetical protein
MVRIRRTLEHLAAGDCTVTLRLRESDDPMLKDLVQTITVLCENTRISHQNVRDTARDLLSSLAALQDDIRRGAAPEELQKQADLLRSRQELLEKALESLVR